MNWRHENDETRDGQPAVGSSSERNWNRLVPDLRKIDFLTMRTGIAMACKRSAGIFAAIVMLLCSCVLLAQQAASSNTSKPIDKEFLAWARHSLHLVKTIAQPLSRTAPRSEISDLKPLQQMIGNAALVSFGEGLHGGAQPLEFRNLLFRYLVEKMGFTAIAIESGLTESDGVNQYVLGGPGDLKTVVDRGFSWTFNTYPQEAALVQWMREYNADSHHARKIQFYGFDVPGSPTNPEAKRGLRTGLNAALQYLETVDPKSATELRNRISSILPTLKFDPALDDQTYQYSHLSQAKRNRLTATISDMISLFKRREAAYVAASSSRAYQWAYRAAIGARQTDELLRQVPVGWTKKDGIYTGWLSGAVAVRDRAMADNVRWIKTQLPPDAKVLLFAHRYHVMTSGSVFSSKTFQPQSFGTYLKHRYGKHLVTIGNLFSENASDCKNTAPPASPESIEGMLATLHVPLFLLDLRTAPATVSAWLNQPHDLYDGGPQKATSIEVGKSFDVIFFSRRVTPAAPCS